MGELFALWRRDRQRQVRSGLSHLGVFLFFVVHGIYFTLALSTLSGAQPQPISPLSWLLGGDLLIVLPFILPAFVLKAFAEERQQQTFEPLLSSGLSSLSLLLGKFAGLCSLWFRGLLSLCPLLAVMWIWGRVGWSELLLAWLAYGLVGLHWMALACAVSCRSVSVISAFAKTALALLLYWALPWLTLIWPDPFYRVFFETFQFKTFLGRCAQGRLLLADVVFVLGGCFFWFWVAWARLEFERVRRFKWAHYLYAGFGGLVLATMLYLGIFIAHKRPHQWDVSQGLDGELSQAYLEHLKQFPEGLEVTVALPKQLSVDTYSGARELIVGFLERSLGAVKGARLRILDPDVDLLEMEQLQRSGIENKSQIGFVLIEFEGRRVVISYRQWIGLATMTMDNEARYFIDKFHGEALMVRAMNRLTRSGRNARLLILTGQGELDVLDKGRLGGSDFLETIQHLGWSADIMRVGIDVIDLKRYQLVCVLDPGLEPPAAYGSLLKEAIDMRLPVLAALGALGNFAAAEYFSPFGVEADNMVVYQRRFGEFDPFVLPVHEFNMNGPLAPLLGKMLLLDRCRPLSIGIPEDPRLEVFPLAITMSDTNIWGEASWDPSQVGTVHRFDGQDVASPHHVCLGVKAVDSKGQQPLLLAIGSRAPFENRSIWEVGHQQFLHESIKWLTGASDESALPPRSPVDHRFRLPLGWLRPLQCLLLLSVPLLLLCSWWWRCRRWH